MPPPPPHESTRALRMRQPPGPPSAPPVAVQDAGSAPGASRLGPQRRLLTRAGTRLVGSRLSAFLAFAQRLRTTHEKLSGTHQRHSLGPQRLRSPLLGRVGRRGTPSSAAATDPASADDGVTRPGGMRQPQTRRYAAATDPAGCSSHRPGGIRGSRQAAVSPAPCFAKLSSGTRLRPASSLGPGLFSWARPLLLAHSCVSVAPETRPGRLSPADAVRIATAATAAATATHCQDRAVP